MYDVFKFKKDIQPFKRQSHEMVKRTQTRFFVHSTLKGTETVLPRTKDIHEFPWELIPTEKV